MSEHGELEVVGAGLPGRMRRALLDAMARAGGARRVSGLSLMAVLCASAVAPVVLVGQELGPVLAAWLATAGSVGSNLLADVITNVTARREGGTERTAAEIELAVAVELEARMAGPGRQAAALRGEVAGLLREHGAQQVLLEALTKGGSDLQEVLAEGMRLLDGQFEEFAGLLGMVRDGVCELQVVAREQRSENQAQGQYRREVQVALARILQLLQDGPPAWGGAGVVYNTLPPDAGAFTGRAAEMSEISGRVEAAAALGGVIAIDGMPGVGKSALAVHVAHRVAAQFPDRQLFVDLHAHTAGRGPADPPAVLAGLLTGDGVDPRRLPTGLEDLAALWRSRMADRRALLVLDNVADSIQVAPLLPGGKDCLVLITSRRHLGDLPSAVGEISLDVLAPEEAVAMFLRMAPQAAGHQDSVAELVTLAGCLPLAISLLARVYAKHRAWSMGELIRETRARLLTLTAEDRTVTAAFDLSYQALTEPRQRFFRLLGLHPGSDLDPYAAAALTGTSLQQADRHLQALHGDHLLTEPGYHRYGMHDLIRAYTRDLTHDADPPAEREAAIARLLDYYVHTAQRASIPVARRPRPAPDGAAPVPAPVLTDPANAFAWLRIEHPNLDAAFTHAHTHGFDTHAVALAAGLAEILFTDGPWTRALEVHQAAADTAEQSGHHADHATAVNNLGLLRQLTGDFPAAADAQAQALEIYRQIGNRFGEANALNDLAMVRQLTGDYPAAAAAQAQALEIYRQIGNRFGEANALNDLGRVRQLTGDFPAAMVAHTHALEIYRQLGRRVGEASALSDLGQARFLTGDYPAAVADQVQALEIFRQIGNRSGEANALTDLGQVRQLAGDYPAAADTLAQALEIYRQLGHRHGEATALTELGQVQLLAGDYPAASAALARALGIYRQIGHRLGEANALACLGRARQLAGDHPAARDALAQALEIYCELGHRGNEAWALNYYAATIAAIGDRPRALELYHRALAVNRELNKPDDEATSLEGIADHHLATGDPEHGIMYLHQAREIYQRLGMRVDTERVQARLAKLEEQ
jgi:tetratricopeptide (TPR) repeat protein